MYILRILRKDHFLLSARKKSQRIETESLTTLREYTTLTDTELQNILKLLEQNGETYLRTNEQFIWIYTPEAFKKRQDEVTEWMKLLTNK